MDPPLEFLLDYEQNPPGRGTLRNRPCPLERQHRLQLNRHATNNLGCGGDVDVARANSSTMEAPCCYVVLQEYAPQVVADHAISVAGLNLAGSQISSLQHWAAM